MVRAGRRTPSDVFHNPRRPSWGVTSGSGWKTACSIGKGELAKSNADQVAKIRRIVEDLSLEVATPEEARKRLNLKGGDRVKF